MERGTSDEICMLEIRRGKLCLHSECKFSNGEELVLTANAWAPSSLALYTQEHFLALRKQIMSHKSDDSYADVQMKTLRNYLIGNAEDCIVKGDKIEISSHLRKLAGLHGKPLWIPSEHSIVIWNPEKYKEWNTCEVANGTSTQSVG